MTSSRALLKKSKTASATVRAWRAQLLKVAAFEQPIKKQRGGRSSFGRARACDRAHTFVRMRMHELYQLVRLLDRSCRATRDPNAWPEKIPMGPSKGGSYFPWTPSVAWTDSRVRRLPSCMSRRSRLKLFFLVIRPGRLHNLKRTLARCSS